MARLSSSRSASRSTFALAVAVVAVVALSGVAPARADGDMPKCLDIDMSNIEASLKAGIPLQLSTSQPPTSQLNLSRCGALQLSTTPLFLLNLSPFYH